MIIVTIILCLSLRTVAGICCEESWIRYGNSCYLFLGNRVTWYQANVLCHYHNAELASIQTAVEDLFIRDYINGFAELGADMKTWLGGNDIDIEGIWRWSTGEKMTYINWYPGEPDIPDGGDCLVLWLHNKTTGYTWGDRNCHFKFHFICEKGLSTDQIAG